MRRHAKASTRGQAGIEGSGRTRLACLAAVSFLMLLAGTSPASAATVTDRPLLFTFNGSDTTAGTILEMRGGMAVDESSGNVYVLDLENDVVDKFNANGEAANFSATGTSSLDGSSVPGGAFNFGFSSTVAVDDSPANTGRIYVANGNHVDAFSPAGTFLWRLTIGGGFACGVAVDTEGHLWLGSPATGMVREYASTGSPPAEISSFAASSPCLLDVAQNGDVYVIDGGTLRKYVGGVLDSTVDTEVQAVAVDQSSATGHVFSLHGNSFVEDYFKEFDSTGALVGTFGVGLLYESTGIAYNSALDRVYVGQFVGPESSVKTGTIKALGPVATGTVPDATSEAVSEIGISKAKLNGKVNPQSVPNSYFFEWQQGTSPFGWRRAKSSAPQSLPEDSSDHAVSFSVTGLKGNTTYQARVVGLNTTSGLRSVSSPVTFTTATPPAPAVTIDEPSAITTTTADLSGTVNPREDLGTTWQVQTSTHPACASGFSGKATHNLESEANSPIAVAEELTGLLPNQHYCVRISAGNGGGTTSSEVKEFTTDAVPPSEVETAFVAPRTDTSARLNGRVNPEGADASSPLTYRFEYSKDGGATWISLSDNEYSGGAREQIVLGDELTELTPNTTYSYRFSAETDAGPASPQGGVKTFTTRTTSEVTLPLRGIELVNNPDKGNQNALSEATVISTSNLTTRLPGISANGERASWAVSGGAPGAPNGAVSTFLAERTASGWKSRSLAPPASEQVGGGDLNYVARATTPTFARFVFDAEYRPVFGEASEAARVRLDDRQNQEVLQTYSWSVEKEGPGPLDMTADGAHVVDINHAGDQLEEIGDGSGEVLSIMPDGTPSSCGLQQGPSFVGGNPTGAAGGNRGTGSIWRNGYHAIATTDASRAYFGAKPNGECGKPWGLYVRNRKSEETTLIDAGTATRDVGFLTTTSDGRQAYFATLSQLDPADANEGADLYRWDEQSEESSCLTCVVPDAGLALDGESYRPIFISEDFSHAYFESEEELVAGHPLNAAERNLYVLTGGEIRFVAKSGDFASGLLSPSSSRLSDDGDILAFGTGAQPDYTADTVLGNNNRQIYVYDDRVQSLECASCAHGGPTTHRGGSELTIFFQLSTDGSTLAFATVEALTPLDVNRTADVYEWRRGVRRLVTDGVSEYAAGLLSAPIVQGIDADGSNILISVTDPGLTGYEQDRVSNLYVARIGGGFPRPSPAQHCDGDSCQGPLVGPPVPKAAASAGFSGRGNVAEKPKARCRKGRVRRKGRCVKRNAHKRHRARANHAKQGRTK